MADAIQGGYKELKLQDGLGGYSSPRMSSEVMDCSMPLTFDQYNFCHYKCQYCFAYYFKTNNPAINKEEFHVKSVNTIKLIKDIAGETKTGRGKYMYDLFYKNKFLFHWGGLADPFCDFEKVNGAGLILIKGLGEMNYPTLFSFKGDTVFQDPYVKVFQKYSNQKNFAFQISMVTYDKKMAREIEIGVPSPDKRIEAIRMLSKMGYWTILRLRPYIIGVTDESIDELLEAALDAGINGISMEFFALDCRTSESMTDRYNWIGKHIGVKDIKHYFKVLSPSERGGYMRLNRYVKEDHVKKIYDFCAKNNLVFGCSDPDFKEMNTSGSCCAMPDNYKPNRGLENWTRNQLTYNLKECRKTYHTTGKITKLFFDAVYPPGVSYLESADLTNDHIKVSGMANATRYAHTYRTMIQGTWNNLRSSANPRNYFNGKVLPVGVDDNDNLIFEYVPLGYEKRWKEEGIDLTR